MRKDFSIRTRATQSLRTKGCIKAQAEGLEWWRVRVRRITDDWGRPLTSLCPHGAAAGWGKQN